ncbi:MAG TPA: hypothetical protein ENJ37_10740 [Deltaproteobacteria bacterium]|nr:hypothetical protein [Deltaproteobacteria bacterium]
MKTKISIAALAVVLLSVPVQAREWMIVGPRALGMGGAHVAVANDATASYWNPAAYGFFKGEGEGDYDPRSWSTDLGGGAVWQIHEDLGEIIDRIVQIDYENLNDGSIPAANVSDFLQLVNELKTFNDNPNRAATVMANARLAVQAGHWGLGGYGFTEISGKGQLDLVNIAPVDPGVTFTVDDFTNPANYGCTACTGGTYLTAQQKSDLSTSLAGLGWTQTQIDNFINAVDYGLTQADAAGFTIPADIVTQVETVASLATSAANSGGSFADNTSRLLFKGIGVIEVPLTYGYALNDNFAIGGNVKYMKGRTYNTAVKVFNTDFGDAVDKARDDYTDSTNFGIDVGALYRVSGDTFRIGLVGRNINSPKFDMKRLLPGDDDYIKEKAQARAGLAYQPWDFLVLAVDIDLTENETTVSSVYKSRNLGGGAEINIWDFLKLRGGLYKNLAESDIGLVYTAGLGIQIWKFRLDVGGAMASKSSTIDGNDIPKEARLEAALSAVF